MKTNIATFSLFSLLVKSRTTKGYLVSVFVNIIQVFLIKLTKIVDTLTVIILVSMRFCFSCHIVCIFCDTEKCPQELHSRCGHTKGK